MEGNFESPISTLKVDFGCTKDCPTDVKNMLQQLKGVKSISIDPNQGKVTVVGNVNPMMLIKLLQKMGKKAQLWSFEKAPRQSTASFHPKKKDTSHCCFESNGSEDEYGTDSDDDFRHVALYGQRSKKMHGQKDRFGFDNKYAAAAPHVTGYHQPMPWYNYQPFSGYNYHPPMPWFQSGPYARPSMYPRPMPLPQYGYYGRDQPVWPTHGHFNSGLPKHNPMIHYTSYEDNYRYTV